MLIFINNVLVSCNLNYYVYFIFEIFNYFKKLLIYNLFYFIVINNFFGILQNWIIDNSDTPISFWKRILSINIFDLLIKFLYKIYQLYKPIKYIDKIFTYLGEKICYDFNQDKNNNYSAYLNQEDYDIIFYLKAKSEDNYIIHEYTIPKHVLSKIPFLKIGFLIQMYFLEILIILI